MQQLQAAGSALEAIVLLSQAFNHLQVQALSLFLSLLMFLFLHLLLLVMGAALLSVQVSYGYL